MQLNEDYSELFEEAIAEAVEGKNKRKWRLILASMKFVNTDSYRKAFPKDASLTDKEIIEKLKNRLEALPDEKKLKLINSRELEAAEMKLTKAEKATKAAGAAGGIAGGSIGVGGGIGLPLVGYIGNLISGGLGGALGFVVSLVIGAYIAAGGAALGLLGLGTTLIGRSIEKNKEKQITMKSENQIYKMLKKESKNTK